MSRYAVLSLSLAYLVTGHGGGQHYIIDGVVYNGNWDYPNNTEGSIQHLWTWDHNVYTLDNPDMACGHDGTPHVKSSYAPIQAGSTVTVNYTIPLDDPRYLWDGGRQWIFGHPYGPMLAYMAACPEEGCEKVDLNFPIWFKIWEAGLLNGTWTKGHWALRDVYMGANLDISTPASLKPGKYLLRHEVINLESGPVQFFPNCIQLEVSGSGINMPAANELVKFPGAYDKDLNISFNINITYLGCLEVDNKIRAICFPKYKITLADYLRDGNELDVGLCLAGIEKAVAHLHSLNLVHGDLTPSNIMLDDENEPILIDFDSCRHEGEKLLKGGTTEWSDCGAKIASFSNDE